MLDTGLTKDESGFPTYRPAPRDTRGSGAFLARLDPSGRLRMVSSFGGISMGDRPGRPRHRRNTASEQARRDGRT